MGLAAFIGYQFINKANAAKRLNYFVQKVSLRFSGLTPIIDIVVGIQNPTNSTIKVGSILGELYINDNFVGTVSGFQLTSIKGLATTYFPISARLSTGGLVSEILSIIDDLLNFLFSI